MRITLIRHLPTEWNLKTWLQGRRDIEISSITDELQQGIKINMEKLLALEPFDLVLASTLIRTHQTATLYGYKFETETLLDELDFGPFEGRPKEDLFAEYEDQWIENPKKLFLGESLTHFENRLLSFLGKYKGFKNVLVFGHGSWIRGLLSLLQYGDINYMNKIIVSNNQCITAVVDGLGGLDCH
jgi:broad specificity phosphatase PhoE